jgi:hypothetical protein
MVLSANSHRLPGARGRESLIRELSLPGPVCPGDGLVVPSGIQAGLEAWAERHPRQLSPRLSQSRAISQERHRVLRRPCRWQGGMEHQRQRMGPRASTRLRRESCRALWQGRQCQQLRRRGRTGPILRYGRMPLKGMMSTTTTRKTIVCVACSPSATVESRVDRAQGRGKGEQAQDVGRLRRLSPMQPCRTQRHRCFRLALENCDDDHLQF